MCVPHFLRRYIMPLDKMLGGSIKVQNISCKLDTHTEILLYKLSTLFTGNFQADPPSLLVSNLCGKANTFHILISTIQQRLLQTSLVPSNGIILHCLTESAALSKPP